MLSLFSLWYVIPTFNDIYIGTHTYFGLLFCLLSVTTTREQVADAQALLDITKSLGVSVKAHSSGGLTPSAFVTHILEKFGQRGGTSTSRKKISRNSIAWNDIGVAVSSVFGRAYGCYTV
jgi:hypothetical protein